MEVCNLMTDIDNMKLLFFKDIDSNPSHSDYYRNMLFPWGLQIREFWTNYQFWYFFVIVTSWLNIPFSYINHNEWIYYYIANISDEFYLSTRNQKERKKYKFNITETRARQSVLAMCEWIHRAYIFWWFNFSLERKYQ